MFIEIAMIKIDIKNVKLIEIELDDMITKMLSNEKRETVVTWW